MKTAADLIAILSLAPHPEGGFFRETYRSEQQVQRPDGQARHASTAIYYLLETGDYSAWHRIDSDELWHFHAGRPLDIHVLRAGRLQRLRLGNPLEAPDAAFQHVVPAGAWFAAEPVSAASAVGFAAYSLVGCTVAPGFEFRDFELATAEDLAQSGMPAVDVRNRLLARRP